jgi:UDP-N-acetyl-2-amino-2-deoxyglucuronate dehydrogenase
VAALDPHDSVGILDQYFAQTDYFREYERFDRHLEKLRRSSSSNRVEYVSICSPNYLHDAHIRLALRIGADAICEKPLVLNPWNLDRLQELERDTGRHIYTILQLRVHPSLIELKKSLQASSAAHKHQVTLTYITSRGPWYLYSWKGSAEKSGGLATNIGIHFFDLLLWLFGKCQLSEVHLNDPTRAGGFLELENATIQWYLSIDRSDLPPGHANNNKTTYRSITIDGKEVEFSEGFADLHTRVYAKTLAGDGFGIDDARPSIELAHTIREAGVVTRSENKHQRVITVKAK